MYNAIVQFSHLTSTNYNNNYYCVVNNLYCAGLFLGFRLRMAVVKSFFSLSLALPMLL